MGILTDDMRRLVDAELGFIATVCPDGTPNLSPKGTTAVWDDDHLVFADLRSPGTVENLRSNPSIEINVVDQLSRKGYRFKGTAVVHTEGDVFERGVRFYEARGTVQARERIRGIVIVGRRAGPGGHLAVLRRRLTEDELRVSNLRRLNAQAGGPADGRRRTRSRIDPVDGNPRRANDGSELRWDDRVAVITGAGRNLGREYALLLASRGAKVVVNDLGIAISDTDGSGAAPPENPAHAVVAEIRATGGDAVANTDDVTSEAGGEAIVQCALDEFGRVDALDQQRGRRPPGAVRGLRSRAAPARCSRRSSTATST